jgi:U3 small nucleolar RNA-associated protein 15
LTASDDSTLKLYDLSTSEQISYLSGHADYVRTAAYVPSNPSLIVSGSYDGTVKLWDTRIPSLNAEGGDDAVDDMQIDDAQPQRRRRGRTPPPGDERGLAREVMSFDHRQPVERVLVHPSGTQVVTAGGPIIKVFDMLSSGQCLRAMSNHQKTVTCLEWGDGKPFASGGKRRLLSAGLDGLIKSYDLEDDYRVGKTMRVGGGVLSLAMAPDEGTLLVGTSNGELTVRKRQISPSEKAGKGKKATGLGGVDALSAGPGEYEAILAAAGVNRAAAERSQALLESLPTTQAVAQQASLVQEQTVNPLTGEIKVRPMASKKKLTEWDRLLKTFKYSDALDSVVSKGVHPSMAFALIRELMHRDGLHQALNARDEVSLLPILRFLFDHVADPRYGSLACDVANVVIDLYTPALGQSTIIDNLFGRMKEKVQREVDFQHNLMEVRGQLQMILAAQA